jgi:hypothetical protein
MIILAYNAASGPFAILAPPLPHPGSAIRRCHQEASMLSIAYTKLVKPSFHNEKTSELDGLYCQRLTWFSEHLSPLARAGPNRQCFQSLPPRCRPFLT